MNSPRHNEDGRKHQTVRMGTSITSVKNSRPVLINPPVVKPCELPAGISRLAGALEHSGHPCTVIDMNIEGLLWLSG
ncbi:MAG TPA: hypothetical protein PKM26_08380, partial [Syntrophorhabdaceae bacterium]|nr:hypothetical protein [Syntrophorhabdaceae bacterium]